MRSSSVGRTRRWRWISPRTTALPAAETGMTPAADKRPISRRERGFSVLASSLRSGGMHAIYKRQGGGRPSGGVGSRTRCGGSYEFHQVSALPTERSEYH
jgi:hypothetical protein